MKNFSNVFFFIIEIVTFSFLIAIFLLIAMVFIIFNKHNRYFLRILEFFFIFLNFGSIVVLRREIK